MSMRQLEDDSNSTMIKILVLKEPQPPTLAPKGQKWGNLTQTRQKSLVAKTQSRENVEQG